MSEPTATLTIAALAWNEGDQIAACFESFRTVIERTGAETLVILDAQADSATAQAARGAAKRVVTSEFVNFSAQRNRALEQARTEWVFFIDADERCTPELAREIPRVLASSDCSAYRVARRNFFFGREVRESGWWPDYQIRLLRRERCRYDEARAVHEVPQVDGTIGTLLYPIVHLNYATWGQFVRKQRTYAPLEAQALYAAGTRARLRSVLGQPLREFKRRFVDFRGYRDGLLGLALALAMAAYKADVYRRLLALGS